MSSASGLVPYSPLIRGLLTGAFASIDDLAVDDFRRTQPRWQGGNLAENLELVEEIRSIAARYDATPSQVALAWVLARGEDVVPIPGTKRRRYLEENAGSRKLALNTADLDRLSGLRPVGDVTRICPGSNATLPRWRAELRALSRREQ